MKSQVEKFIKETSKLTEIQRTDIESAKLGNI